MSSAELATTRAVSARRPRRWPWLVGLLAGLLTALSLLWDWNWFRPLVEARASAAIGRKVTLSHFDLKLSRHPTVILDGLEVANPDGFEGTPYFAHVERLVIVADAIAYLHGRHVVLQRIDLARPDVNAFQMADGRASWNFPAASNGSSSTSTSAPQIGDVVITDGTAHVVAPKVRADFKLGASTRDGPDGHPQIVVTADGTYAAAHIVGRATGGGLLTLRDSASPYPIDAEFADGPTKVELKGTVQDPLHFKGTDLKLHLSGPDLALLEPLSGVAIPKTPPYDITGQLDYVDRKVRFSDFAGRLGASDISGTVAIDPTGARPIVDADLSSRRVDLADLGGFIGSQPGRVTTPGQTATQKKEVAKAEASNQLLPNTRISLPKLRAADVHLRYKGARIEGRGVPFDNISVVMDINDGAINLHPISLGVGAGDISGQVALAPTAQSDLRAKADISFTRVDVGRLLAATGAVKGAGLLGGRAEIDATGDSLSSLLGHGDGHLVLLLAGGNLSALVVDLSGLEFGNALLSALGVPSRASLECFVADLPLQHGVLDTRSLIAVTSEADIRGTGSIDLAHERLDYRLRTESRHFSVGSLPTDIGIRGTFKNPSILPNFGELAARGGAAVALGVLLTPLGALLPTVQFGAGDADQNACVSVIRANGKRPKCGVGSDAAKAKTIVEIARSTPRRDSRCSHARRRHKMSIGLGRQARSQSAGGARGPGLEMNGLPNAIRSAWRIATASLAIAAS